jgi:hypothetical protein
MLTYADVCWYADICWRILTLERDMRRLLLAHAESLARDSEDEGGSDAGEEQRGSSGSELPAAQVC